MTDYYYIWESNEKIMRGFSIVFAIIAGLLFIIQILFLQKLSILPVYALPLLSFSIAFENVVLFCGPETVNTSSTANSAHFFHSIIIPLFVVIFFELTFRLHEARNAKFCFIPFDQSEDVINDWGFTIKGISLVLLWTVRIISLGLFVMNVLVDYRFVETEDSYRLVGRGGYVTLSENSSNIPLWLSLIPPMFLSFIGLYLSFVLYK